MKIKCPLCKTKFKSKDKVSKRCPKCHLIYMIQGNIKKQEDYIIIDIFYIFYKLPLDIFAKLYKIVIRVKNKKTKRRRKMSERARESEREKVNCEFCELTLRYGGLEIKDVGYICTTCFVEGKDKNGVKK